MAGKRIGYVRVSTADQNPDRQLQDIILDKKFVDYASGQSMNRPQLDLLLDYVREDDLIIVHSMDRMARNVKDLIHIIDGLVERNISVQFLKESLIFTAEKSPISNLLLAVMGAIAEFEHSLIKERQMEGIALAKKEGKYRGRKNCLSAEKVEMLKMMMETTRTTKTQMAKELGICRWTLYKYMKLQNQSA
jgi:DNA invertase Pin-like site-specific DNA recombinase